MRSDGHLYSDSPTRIEAYPVPDHARPRTLPRHFGRHTLAVEGLIYDFMARFARRYAGGYWRFVELSNGGFYMRPPAQSYELCIGSNGFEGRMSADAAGITVCLFTFSHLSFHYTTEVFSQHFHWLRDFALNHTEASLIFQAID